MKPRGRNGSERQLRAELEELRRQYPELAVELLPPNATGSYYLRFTSLGGLSETRGRELAYALTWLTVAYPNLGWMA